MHLDNGQALEIPEPRRRQYARHRNTMMLLGLRPEHLTETPRPGSALMTVAVDVVEPMGMETMEHFRLPAAKGAMAARYSGVGLSETLYTARVMPETPAVAGELMELEADMNQMHLIDPQSGLVV